VSLLLALIVNYNIEMLVAPICLYTESTWGINIVKETIVLLLSGASIPLVFFPETFRKIVEYLPFRAVYDIPLTVLLKKNGTDSFDGLVNAIGIQLIWCVVLTICGNLFWNHAVKKITVNGG
jgi:ABC-2 type transport system permease protein